jgi:hypothetical protein
MKHATLAIAITLLPGALAAQEASQARSQGKAQARTETTAQAQARTPRARIDAAVQAAAEAQIPTALLRSKIAEGEAKRVGEERIATAVEARFRALLRASSALSRAEIEQRSAADLAVAADALEAGVSEGALVRVARSAPEERRVVAMAVVADLVRLGQSSEAAVARVTSAAGTSAGLANLNAQVASQLRVGGLTSTLDAAGVVRLP